MERFAGVEARICAGGDRAVAMAEAGRGGGSFVRGILRRSRRVIETKNHRPFLYIPRTCEAVGRRGAGYAFQRAFPLGDSCRSRSGSGRRSRTPPYFDSLLLA